MYTWKIYIIIFGTPGKNLLINEHSMKIQINLFINNYMNYMHILKNINMNI